ncbi:MAG TPA: hypothetical protein V6D20_07670, partial [Candidatus Obscuribacterales bacterium]
GDRIVIRSLGQTSAPEEVAAAPSTPPVTFALNAQAETFQLLSSQLGGEGLVSSLIGQELPELATLPPSAEKTGGDRQTTQASRNGATTNAWGQQPVAIAPANAEAVPIREPLLSFVPELNDPNLSDESRRINLATPDLDQPSAETTEPLITGFSFSNAPEWMLGFAPVENQLEEPLAIALRANPGTPEQLISFLSEPTGTPETIVGDRRLAGDNTTDDTVIFGEQPLLTSLLDFANIQTSEFSFPVSPEFSILNPAASTDLALNSTGDNPLILSQAVTPNPPFALNSAIPNARQVRRLEAALTFLLSDDVDAIDALLLQATGNRAPEVRGQLVDLDRVMQLNSAAEGTL